MARGKTLESVFSFLFLVKSHQCNSPLPFYCTEKPRPRFFLFSMSPTCGLNTCCLRFLKCSFPSLSHDWLLLLTSGLGSEVTCSERLSSLCYLLFTAFKKWFTLVIIMFKCFCFFVFLLTTIPIHSIMQDLSPLFYYYIPVPLILLGHSRD